MMPGKFNSAMGYLALEKVIGLVQVRLFGAIPDRLGYAGRALEQRLLQRLVELGRREFVCECARRYEQGEDILPVGEAILRFAGFSVEMPLGCLRLDFRLLTRSFAEFFLHWLHVSWNVVLAALLRGEKQGAGSLLFGVGAESLKVSGNDARFVEYCRLGPITPLAEADHLIVQTALGIKSVRPDNFEYTRFPLFVLMRGNTLSLREFLRFFMCHFRALGAYLVAVMHYPPISTLGRDFAYHAMLTHLNCKGLIKSVVITNSNHSAQPLWMSDLPERRFQTHMVWYSQNTRPLIYADDALRFDFPTYRHMRIDVSWVWTDEYAAYLRSLGVSGEMHTVGPILWQLPQVHVGESLKGEDLTFAVFDITPVRNREVVKLGAFRNYYSSANMIAFLQGIVNTKTNVERLSGRKVRILLKNKRGFNPRHDPAYINLIEDLRAKGTLELIEFNANTYSLIGQADLVIVVPYSSPAYVADHMGIPVAFFDPTCDLLPDYDKRSHISFAAGEDALLQAALRIARPIKICEG